MDEMKRNEPLSVGGWIGTMIVLAIPIVNLIMLLVWAFGRGNTSRKNYCIAVLVLALIGIIISIIISLFFGPAVTSFYEGLLPMQSLF